MDRNLSIEAMRVTEAAALYAARLVGRGDEENAHLAALRGMEKALHGFPLDGTLIVGEDPESDSPLKTGARLGNPESPHSVDIAIKPLEGTTPCATGGPNAISVLAFSESGGLLNVPKVYMEKIAVGPDAVGVVSLDASVEENLKNLADRKARYIEDLTVVILDRPRNERYIEAVRKVGARIQLIGDGDVSGAVATAFPHTGIDMLIGIGGAPEGLLAAIGLKCIRGDFQGRFVVQGRDDEKKLREAGFTDLNRIYQRDDLAKGQVMFAATGITDGMLLQGVRFGSGGAHSNSLAMRSKSGTVRFINTTHHFELQPVYE
jgi:fructose-1,6-bisphosphatase class II